jgi:hypothetical protein
MDSHSSMNAQFEIKKPIHTTPEGYFEKLQARLNEIPGRHAKQVQVIRFRAWTWSSVAAVFIFGSILFWNFEKTSNEIPYSDKHLEMMAAQMDAEQIYEYYGQMLSNEYSDYEALELMLDSGIEEVDFINY